jgi:hypothetical protein
MVNAESRVNITHALSLLFKYYIKNHFSFKQWQHLEYLPLVAARIHNASIGTDLKTGANQQTQSSNKNKDIFIPDKQLKQQYIQTLEYCLVHSSNVQKIRLSNCYH